MKNITFFILLLIATVVNGQDNIQNNSEFYISASNISKDTNKPSTLLQDDVFKGFTYYVDNNDRLNLISNQALEKVEIYNVLGQLMISKNLSYSQESVEISELNSGIYIVRVKIAGRDKSFKIVKT
ncbi:MAG: T9SS type A sorting domain-containing protein [Aequorivita sp.]